MLIIGKEPYYFSKCFLKLNPHWSQWGVLLKTEWTNILVHSMDYSPWNELAEEEYYCLAILQHLSLPFCGNKVAKKQSCERCPSWRWYVAPCQASQATTFVLWIVFQPKQATVIFFFFKNQNPQMLSVDFENWNYMTQTPNVLIVFLRI